MGKKIKTSLVDIKEQLNESRDTACHYDGEREEKRKTRKEGRKGNLREREGRKEKTEITNAVKFKTGMDVPSIKAREDASLQTNE